MKQIEVTILGQGYLLGCPEGGEALLRAAVQTVDREMVAIRDGGRVKARERIAVLAALNIAYQLAQAGSGGRPAPEAASPGADAAAGASGPPAATTSPGEGAPDTPDLPGLLRRLDAVLERDGHLL